MRRAFGVAIFTLSVTAAWRPACAQAVGHVHPRWEIQKFDFSPNGVWRNRARQVAQTRRALVSLRAFGQLNSGLGLAGAVLTAAAPIIHGTLQVPAILMDFSDTPAPPFPESSYATVLFGTTPPAGQPYTIRTFYEQMSQGNFSMQGQVLGWVQLAKPESSYTGGRNCNDNPFGTANCNGIFDSNTPTMVPIDSLQAGLREALARLDSAGVDWGQFDNDGPDGHPNSGDDDGYVDMAIFIHPDVGGECGGNNNVWSHRYVLTNQDQSAESAYVTKTPAHNGGFIKVRDYTIQAGVGGSQACNASQIMPIGTAAHESGHGLGLPDLYDTRYLSEGLGEWGLMGSGNYSDPPSPSRMEAWSLSELGWITILPLTGSGTYSLSPAGLNADTAFIVRPQGANPRGEYFLIENREAVLADTALIRNHCAISGIMGYSTLGCGGGLMILHVDSAQLANTGFHAGNVVNYGPIHGVELEQADGLGNLDRNPNTQPYPTSSNRGDGGDLYPGVTGNTAFTPYTNPAAVKNYDGTSAGFAIDSIRLLSPNGIVSFRLQFLAVGQVLAAQLPDVLQQLFNGSSALSAAQIGYINSLASRTDSTHIDVGSFLAWVRASHPTPTGFAAPRVAAVRGTAP
ncbi:MAG TPA: M6 family metalloprotease domain-containing protein [Gemmatimonadales bacterium]|nr:M6 family metalloprotease domain-containing protein [Gemmatimonadales bacterium]